MGCILHPLLSLLASVTRQELARQVRYLIEENKILRARLPERLGGVLNSYARRAA
jgi:putative transposase